MHFPTEKLKEAQDSSAAAPSIMSAIKWIWCCLFLLVALAPASVIARLHPGASSTASTMILSEGQNRVPVCDESLTATTAQALSSEPKKETVDFTSPQEDSIAFFHQISRGAASTRRWLVGPGSSPPTCRQKCGMCQPCKPVHIAIGSPHGVISETEYYPEVWRCQCGNKLYMP